MIPFKKLIEINAKPIKEIFVHKGGIFQIQYPDCTPFFYANGQMIPNTQKLKNGGNARISGNIINVGHLDDLTKDYRWDFIDLYGETILSGRAGDKYQPNENRTLPLPRTTWPTDIPQMSDDEKDLADTPLAMSYNITPWSTYYLMGAVLYLRQQNKFYQLPMNAKLIDNRNTEMKDFITAKGAKNKNDLDYLQQTVSLTASANPETLTKFDNKYKELHDLIRGSKTR